MTDPNRFFSSNFNDDRITLNIVWLPDRNDVVLIGFTSSLPDYSIAGYLPAPQVPLLAEYLFLMKKDAKGAAMRFALSDDLTLIARPSNQGDPYEEGVEIEIDRGDYNGTSIFISEWRIEDLIQAFTKGMPAELCRGKAS